MLDFFFSIDWTEQNILLAFSDAHGHVVGKSYLFQSPPINRKFSWAPTVSFIVATLTNVLTYMTQNLHLLYG